MILNQVVVSIVLVALTTVVCTNRSKRSRRKNDYPDKSLWKKEYEDELTDAMLSSKKRENNTRVALSAMGDNEAVIEKLMDSITASEKYLKKVDSIDFRLNRLDIEVHEKTNSMLKQLSQLMKMTDADGCSEKVTSLVDTVKNYMSEIKGMLEQFPRSEMKHVDGSEIQMDPTLESRLSVLDSQVKSILLGVESIVTTISEVKNRQYNKPVLKSDMLNSGDAVNILSEFRKALREQKASAKKCDCNKFGRTDRAERYPTDCNEIQMQGFNISGIYKIKPDDMEPFYVLCDLSTAGGGWTVFQNRFDGSQDFYKVWSDYEYGFGNLAGEFWLGLEKLNSLTNQKLYELRIDMETQHGQEAFAGYSVFTVGPQHEGYRISTLGTFYGTAGDSLSYHAGQKFSTMDVDNDEWKDGVCAIEHSGAWWYKECDKSNLNGKYPVSGDDNRGQSMYWISFKGPNYPLTKTKMMIRPLPASKPINYFDSNKKLESLKSRPLPEKLKAGRQKDKIPFDGSHQLSYRYDDPRHEAYFPNYA